MANLGFLKNKLNQLLEEAREDKRGYLEDLQEDLISMGTTQEELENNFAKKLVIKRLAESTDEKEIKILLTTYTKACQERRKITTLRKILSYLED